MEVPYGRQTVDDDDIKAVADVLRGDWLTQGPAVDRFEKALAEKVEARHAVVFSSGSAALHGAAFAAEAGPGRTVATSALTFVGTISGAVMLGALAALTDIDPTTLNMDPTRIPACDILFVVHLNGLPVDLSLLKARPQVVIEDAAHALGARTQDGPVGNCARSDMTCFSFHPVKAITSGEGGAVTTNSDELAQRLRRFRNHGMRKAPGRPAWHYEIAEVAPNYRLSDIHAALGYSQLRHLDEFIERRNILADGYRQMLADVPLELPPAAPDGTTHAYHLFAIRVAERERVYRELHSAGVKVQVHYVPMYHHAALQDCGTPEDFPATEQAYAGLLSLPLFPSLTEEGRLYVVEAVRRTVTTP